MRFPLGLTRQLTVAALVMSVAASVHCRTAAGSTDQRPLNVLFIAVDDLRPELGCYGQPVVQTPHIDALAKKSLLFTRAYCQQAVCNPSRVSLLTGLRPDSTKVWDLATEFRSVLPNVTTLPQHFKKQGYQSLGYGKIFHNPWPDNVSWSEPHQWPKNARLWSNEARDKLRAFKAALRQKGTPERAVNRLRASATEVVEYPENRHVDSAIAEQAIQGLRRLSKRQAPFFLAAGFIRPHLPFVVPKPYWDLYERERIPLAVDALPPRNSPRFAMNTMYELRDYFDYRETLGPRAAALTEAQQRELKHGYYAAVSFVDAQVGRILAELDRLQLRDRTIVVLWGDHGWKLGEHRSWCKQTNYEIDTRVPLIISAPGRRFRHGTCDAIVESLDVYPTLCELTGLMIPEHLEGASLAPLLEQPTREWKDVAVSQFPRRDKQQSLMGYALRTNRYRYVEWLDRDTCNEVAFELYDHMADPAENVNLSGKPELQATLSELSGLLWDTLKRPQPSDLRKPRSTRATLRINNGRLNPVEIFWLAPDGRRVPQGTIGPGRTLTIKTTRSHRFQIGRNDEDVVVVTRSDQSTTIKPLGDDREPDDDT